MKPTYYPSWATSDVNLPVSGNPNKVRPDPSLRDLGYDLGQKPSAEEFNWMWNNICDWITHFDEEGLFTTFASQATAEAGIVTDEVISPFTLLKAIQKYGLGGGGVLVGDFHTYHPNGFYRFDNSTDNKPPVNSGGAIRFHDAVQRGFWLAFQGGSSSQPLTKVFFKSVLDVNSDWVEIYHTGNLPSASSTVEGIVKLATGTEAAALSDTTIAVTPSALNSVNASTTTKGLVKLNDATNSNSTTEAATANAVRLANNNANSRVPTSRTISTTAPLTGGGSLASNLILGIDTSGLVPATRTISTTAPLTGGGSLGSNLTLGIDTSDLVPTGRQVSAGTGLTGGGDLSANRTFNIDAASTAEQITGTSTSKVSTPSSVTGLFTDSTRRDVTGEDGYQILPGGLMIQWTTWVRGGLGGSGPFTHNFPKTFSTAPFTVQLSALAPSGGVLEDQPTHTTAPSSTQVGFRTGVDTTHVYILAIGLA